MKLTTREDHGQPSDPRAGHKMTDDQGGHDRHAGHSVAMFRDKFWLSFALTIPVVIWSSDVQGWFGYTAPSFPGSKLIPAVLGTLVFIYGGLVFIRGAQRELADHKPGMMTLIGLAIIVAFGTSLAATFGLFEIDVWWELASLITIMVLGHWLEMRAISQARGALSALAALLPDTAERVTGTDTQSVPLSELRTGDVLLIRPGARVPADGTVIEGAAEVDESMITGESKTVPKGAGARVTAGTVASGGSLRVRVTAIGDQTALSGIMRLVAAAQASGSRTQALADRAAAILFYVAVVAGAVTFTFWWLSGDKEDALIRTATVLIIACPHALGLAIPLVIAIATSLGARNGLLVKDRLALERARNLDMVIFDKTGTLTRGAPAVSDVAAAPGITEGDLIGQAAAVESSSEHPLAKAIDALGIRVAMITGDSQAVADSVARRLGIDEVAAEVLPADKASAVKRFQAGGNKVAMVGDGVNDAPALATANVGIAIGAGTDVAIESAGIVLVRSDPSDVVGAIELSHATYRKMVQNLVWASAYNLVSIPIAGGLLVRWGFDLPMSVGAVAMSASTIIVAANAQLLRRVKLRRASH